MNIKKTITSMFLLPVLGMDKPLLSKYEYLNSYSDYTEEGAIEYPPHVVYVLFKPKDKNLFKSFLDDLYEKNEFILEDFNLDEEFIVVVFKLDERFDRDYELIKKSKYSRTSNEFKDLFPQMIEHSVSYGRVSNRKSLQNLIFSRDISLRKYWEDKIGSTFGEDDEVWYNFNLDEETLNFDNVLKQIKGKDETDY